jgi:mRNA interferase MazF
MVWKTSKNVFNYKRGEVYLIEEHMAQGGEQKKTRPWVVISASPINAARSTIVGVPLSTQAPEKPPLSIKIYFNNHNVCAVVDQMRALDKKRFLRFEGELSPAEMALIEDGLRSVLAL